MILDCRYLHEESGISENDIAKRLMDYGYHAPTLSFPVHGTLMIEPTESESLWELDNFVNVMQTIWQEIQEVKEGKADKEDNVLLNAPHPEYEVVANEWNHSYSREKAAYPIETVRENKFWINVARVDNTLGDRKPRPCPPGWAHGIRSCRFRLLKFLVCRNDITPVRKWQAKPVRHRPTGSRPAPPGRRR